MIRATAQRPKALRNLLATGLMIGFASPVTAEDKSNIPLFSKYEYISVSCQLTEEPFYHFEIVSLPGSNTHPLNPENAHNRSEVDLTIYGKDRSGVVAEIDGILVFQRGKVALKNDPNRNFKEDPFAVEIRYNLLIPNDKRTYIIRIDEKLHTGFCDNPVEINH